MSSSVATSSFNILLMAIRESILGYMKKLDTDFEAVSDQPIEIEDKLREALVLAHKNAIGREVETSLFYHYPHCFYLSGKSCGKECCPTTEGMTLNGVAFMIRNTQYRATQSGNEGKEVDEVEKKRNLVAKKTLPVVNFYMQVIEHVSKIDYDGVYSFELLKERKEDYEHCNERLCNILDEFGDMILEQDNGPLFTTCNSLVAARACLVRAQRKAESLDAKIPNFRDLKDKLGHIALHVLANWDSIAYTELMAILDAHKERGCC